MLRAHRREPLLDRVCECFVVLPHGLTGVRERRAQRRRWYGFGSQGGERCAIDAGRFAPITAAFDEGRLLEQGGRVPWLDRQCTLDRRHLLFIAPESLEACGQVRPQRRMTRIGVGRAAEKLARAGGLPALHELKAAFVQYGGMIRRELRRPGQKLFGFAAAARGAGGLGRLDDSENARLIGRHRVAAHRDCSAQARRVPEF